MAAKEKVIAEFFDNKIKIDVGFTGAKLSFFGAIDVPGDVVVAITGPRKNIKVRKKEKKIGFWINSESENFFDVPSFYYVASNKPLDDLDASKAFFINQIGFKNIRFAGGEDREKNERDIWKNGIIESMVKLGRYNLREENIKLSDEKLFKTEFNFSSDILEGEYIVDTLLLKSGNVLGVKRSFINVSKSGLGQKIHFMANSHSLSYGLIAVLFAVLFGFLSNIIIRKVNE